MTHLRDPPFDDVAKVFVVDVIVLLPDASLSTFFQLILTISDQNDPFFIGILFFEAS